MSTATETTHQVIRHRFTGAVLFEGEYASLKDCAVAAVKARADLANANLARANLARANLAGADLADAYLANADLANAYLANADLANADLAGANLANANLARANLAGADLAGADLADAYLAGAYLADAYLAGAYLADADLADAYLANADLAGARNVPETNGSEAAESAREPEPADPRERYARRAARYRASHPDVPVIESLDAKLLALIESGRGKLRMASWHSCETTHCRAGWAITLAGEAGAKLEEEYGPHRAGVMIYRASTGRVPHFFASDERALEDIREQAALQVAS